MYWLKKLIVFFLVLIDLENYNLIFLGNRIIVLFYFILPSRARPGETAFTTCSFKSLLGYTWWAHVHSIMSPRDQMWSYRVWCLLCCVWDLLWSDFFLLSSSFLFKWECLPCYCMLELWITDVILIHSLRASEKTLDIWTLLEWLKIMGTFAVGMNTFFFKKWSASIESRVKVMAWRLCILRLGPRLILLFYKALKSIEGVTKLEKISY